MPLKELENQLKQSVKSYESMAITIIDSFHGMSQEDRGYFLPETLDNMNKQAFYTFDDFQEHII